VRPVLAALATQPAMPADDHRRAAISIVLDYMGDKVGPELRTLGRSAG